MVRDLHTVAIPELAGYATQQIHLDHGAQQMTIPASMASELSLPTYPAHSLHSLPSGARGMHPGGAPIEGMPMMAPGFALHNGMMVAVDEAYQAHNVSNCPRFYPL